VTATKIFSAYQELPPAALDPNLASIDEWNEFARGHKCLAFFLEAFTAPRLG
jgi:hypothetical protein